MGFWILAFLSVFRFFRCGWFDFCLNHLDAIGALLPFIINALQHTKNVQIIISRNYLDFFNLLSQQTTTYNCSIWSNFLVFFSVICSQLICSILNTNNKHTHRVYFSFNTVFVCLCVCFCSAKSLSLMFSHRSESKPMRTQQKHEPKFWINK